METDDQREPVEVLAEEFAERRRRGEDPSVDQYALAHPQHADRIRRIFPLLLLMEEVGKETVLTEPTDTSVLEGTTNTAPPEAALPLSSSIKDSQRQLYTRRASMLYLVGAVVFFLMGVLIWRDLSPALPLQALGWGGLSLFFAGSLCDAVFALMCRYNSRLRLASLRRIELITMSVIGITVAYAQVKILGFTGGMDFEGPQHLQSHVNYINFARIFEWFILIITYGLFIPNPWRRTAAISVWSFAMAVAVPLWVSKTNLVVAENLPYLLTWTVAGVLPACVIGTFGSFTIGSLQQELLEAKKMGPYRLIEKIGVGGMGEVYRAQHRLLKRPCAIKLIRSDRENVAGSLERFEREVQITSTLTHPNTVDVFDYGGTANGTFYYVMEYLDGPNLDELVSQHGPLDPPRVLHVIRQLCGALGEAHERGIVHRDIKPSNVILCKQGGLHDIAKLLDFGLVSQELEESADSKLTQLGTAIGTPQFMSPEQAQGDLNLDSRSDIYSLGAVTYFLLTGRPPIQGHSMLDTIAAVVAEPVTPVSVWKSDVPADLERVVMRCLQKDSNERFRNVHELLAEIDRCDLRNTWTQEDAKQWWTEHRPASMT